jgi:hypothetical protein
VLVQIVMTLYLVLRVSCSSIPTPVHTVTATPVNRRLCQSLDFVYFSCTPKTQFRLRQVGMSSSKANTTHRCESAARKKDKNDVKRLWLPWEFCKLIEPLKDAPLPPFGQEKPSSVTEDEQNIMVAESETLFPVGFYDMTPAKRGVTKGRGDWKGKEALRLAHCSAEKNGCLFKARFCRIANGMEIFTSGTHNVSYGLVLVVYPYKYGIVSVSLQVMSLSGTSMQTD